jgi:tripartite-type tricarboxylate transporter receptor subunit TctC
LAGEWFKQVTGLNSIHIPYKGDSPALNDQLGGHVNYSILSITPVLPHVKQGSLRVLAVTSNTRSSALPGVPTLAEALKTPDFNIATWFGLLAPAKTPIDVVNKLAETTQKVLALPDVQQRFEAQAMEVAHVSPQEFGAMIHADTERATKIARSIGIQPE